MKMKPIAIEEIEYASRVLFNGDPTKFYDDINARTGERVEAIQCLDNKPIVACPGSGKTTVLLAKLIILANRMPFEDGRGICVLTHTNVAIDLIKKKLGADASKLFAYPNFFGTIQSFVDKFLAIPFCSQEFKSRVRYIDNERNYFEAKNFYYGLKFGEKETKTLKNSLYREGTRDDDWGKVTTNEKNLNAINFLSCLTIDYIEGKIRSGLLGDTFRKKNSPSENARRDFEEIVSYKESLIKDGIISFNDAYCLSEYYLDKSPTIKEAFQERFKFVFIDEMQDTATHQSKIINTLFKGSDRTIVQEFGDPNQAIYEYDGQKGKWEYDENDCLHLAKSKRFGEQISKVINPLRINTKEPSIEGENQDSILPPHLIIFDNADQTVLNEFGKLIIQYELHKIQDPKFVAIGRVGKEKDVGKITLKTYWNGFEKESAKKKEHFPTLIEYLAKDIPDRGNYAERIVNGILRLLEQQDFKLEVIIKGKSQKRRVTKTTLFDYLKKENEELYFEFKTFISACGLKIKNAKENYSLEVYHLIVAFVNLKILPIKEIKPNSKIEFLKIPDNIKNQNQQERKTNIYEYEDELGNKVPIKINTIHGEKGETHTATLFFETYYNKKYDSERISKQLLGKKLEGDVNEENHMAAKLSYVAMSRPEMLLCFAVSSERISEEFAKTKLEPIGWKI